MKSQQNQNQQDSARVAAAAGAGAGASVTSINSHLALLDPHKTIMIDLHGLSVKDAKREVINYVNDARISGHNKIRIVTGRGNHASAQGRGILYKSFSEWLQTVQNNIAAVNKYDGYYEVEIKDNLLFRNPFMAFINDSVDQLLKKDIEKIKEGAAKGNVEDRIALALCYDKGLGVEQSYSKATGLYLQLAKGKNPIALYEVGCRYFIGKGIRQNDAKALEFLKLSAAQEYVLAEFQLGEIYWKGFGMVTIDYSAANQYFLKAAKQGHAEAARKLGCAYAQGLGTNINCTEAIRWWELAVKGNDCVAAFNLHHFYREGKGVSKDPKKAIYYLNLSAEWGDPDGQFILGHLYYVGDKFVTQDKKKGLEWLHLSAENLCANAQLFLFQYYNSLDDETKAKKYLIDAADNGHIKAQFLMAYRYSKDKPDLHKEMVDRLLKQPIKAVLQEDDFVKSTMVELLLCEDSTQKQIKKGVTILEKLANDEKRIDVLDRLGQIHIVGLHKKIKQDIKKGYQYWLRGAAAEDPDCLCSLAYFWEQGFGGEVNEKKALKYFHQAADKGNANANNQLGIYFRNNKLGVKKNPKKAAEYFQRAMELDNPSGRSKKRSAFGPNQNVFKHAASNLARLYLKGDDNFPENEETAIELFKQSAADGMADDAFLLALYYQKKQKIAEFIYYLDMAVDLGDTNAKALQKQINITPQDNEIAKQWIADMNPKQSLKNKNQMCNELQRLSNCLGEQLEWKIPEEKKCAWAYISNDLQKKLASINELKPYLKRSTNKRDLIVIEDIYECKLDKIAFLFNKAMIPSASKSVAVADDTIGADAKPHVYAAAASLASFGFRAIHQNLPHQAPILPLPKKLNVQPANCLSKVLTKLNRS